MDLFREELDLRIDNSKTPLERWEDLGFLEGLSKEKKEIAANNFEKMAIFLIETNIETIVFPIIRRIIQDDETVIDINIQKLLSSFYNAHEKFKTLTDNDLNSNSDIETEFCLEVVKEYLNKKGN